MLLLLSGRILISVEYRGDSIITESSDCSVQYTISCWYVNIIQVVGDRMYLSVLSEGDGRYGR